MPKPTPFHPRTQALCHSYQWKEWAGYYAACNYDAHSEREYFAIRNAAGLLDVSPLYKYEFTGPDAAAVLARIMTRDITKLAVGRVTYSCWCDEDGKALDDGTVARLSKEHFRVTASEPWLLWFRRLARGADVTIRDSSRELAALALQGPRARAILDEVVDFDMNRMRFFRVRRMKLAGRDLWVSRTGYTGDLGYELWMAPEDALPIWDALVEAGKPHRMEPMGLDALDVSRLEAGFILQGVDYFSARFAVIEARKSSPYEIGLGGTVELDRAPFMGQAALKAERAAGSPWALVALSLDWEEIERLYASYDLPPHLAPVAWRSAVPVYASDGRTVIGQATSGTWSPLLKQSIALATVRTRHAAVGARLKMEYTVEYARQTVTATVVDRPLFDPERKRATPGVKSAKVTG